MKVKAHFADVLTPEDRDKTMQQIVTELGASARETLRVQRQDFLNTWHAAMGHDVEQKKGETMTLGQLRMQILMLARSLGLLAHLSGDRDGFPCLIIAGHSGMIIATLENDEAECTREQEVWLTAFARVQQAQPFQAQLGMLMEVYVWSPERWANGTIAARLKAIC